MIEFIILSGYFIHWDYGQQNTWTHKITNVFYRYKNMHIIKKIETCTSIRCTLLCSYMPSCCTNIVYIIYINGNQRNLLSTCCVSSSTWLKYQCPEARYTNLHSCFDIYTNIYSFKLNVHLKNRDHVQLWLIITFIW